MKKFLSIVAGTVLIGAGLNSSAQDVHFSQFYENSILRNPALTGIFSGDLKAGVNYRTQWGSVATPYTTGAASVETRVLTNRSVGDYCSFGFAGYSDKAGEIDFKSQGVYGSVAYNKALSQKHNTYLSAGFMAGYINRSVDMMKMRFSSQYQNGFDQTNASGESAPFKSLQHFDVGAGVSLNSSAGVDNNTNYYVGVSMFHLNRPTEIFNGGYTTVKLPIKVQLNAGVNMTFSRSLSLAVHANYSRQQPYTEALVGALLSLHNYTPGLESNFAFSFGAFYRANDAVIPTVKIEYENVSLGFSQDVTHSDLAQRVGGAGASEVTLYVRTKYRHLTNPQDGIMCPRFESNTGAPFN